MRLWNFLWKALLVSLALLVLWPWFVDAQTTNATNTTVTVTQGGTAVVATGGHEAVRLTFWLDQIAPLRQLLFGFPIWEYIAIAIYAIIAFLVARILDYLIGVRLQSWAAKTTTKVDDWILRLLHGPLKLIVFIIFLHIGLEVFHWPDWIAVWLKKGLYVIIAFSITYMVLRLVDLLISHWRVRAATSSGISSSPARNGPP